jgi:predicted dehydrogenase
MDRRSAIKSAAAAALFHIVPRHVLGGQGYTPPSERIHLALVGCGGRGREVLKEMLKYDDVLPTSVADPARRFSTKGFYYRDEGGRDSTQELLLRHYQSDRTGYQCGSYSNYLEMLDQEKDLDAVICGTPDHLHAIVSIKSMLAGKHVYCEKPLTHNIWEARVVSRVARDTGLATQMGNQGHASNGIRQTVEWIRDGVIGDVREVKVWVGASRWNPSLTGRPEGDELPEDLDWNLWLGPREERPFSRAYFPVAWRDFWAFGNSSIGDFGCHDLDAAFWALELTSPTRIEFHPAGNTNAEIGPHGSIGYFNFPALPNRPEIKITWYDGGLQPEQPVDWPENIPFPSRGILFQGELGTIFCGGAGGAPQLLGNPNYQGPPPSIERVSSHYREWLDAIKGKTKTGSDFVYGARLTEVALLGALSLRTRQTIRWDPDQMKAVGNDAADTIIREPYRDGWQW